MKQTYVHAALAVTLVVLGLACSGPTANVNVQGAGSTRIYPLLSKWADEYEKATAVKIRYNSIGSGSGLRAWMNGEVDFACIDRPLTSKGEQEAALARGEIAFLPLALSGIVPAYRLEEIKAPLRFTGPVLADIFLGKIKKWNDPALQKINPKVELPDRVISVCYFSAASGTTALFTAYLSKVSMEWKEKVGSGLSVKWPIGTPCKGGESPSLFIRGTPGALGYLELAAALEQQIQHGLVQNMEGSFVRCSAESLSAAAQKAPTDGPERLASWLLNNPDKGAYPITGATWAVFSADQSGERGNRLVNFLAWAIHDGQELVPEFHWGRLPKQLVQKAEEKLKQARTSKRK